MNYEMQVNPQNPALIDLRSDTVTQPTQAMRAAMASAKVGDDVYGDDPSVNMLEDRAAKLLGKEAGLFVASGTQSNLVAVLSHCQRGDEILVGDHYHIYRHEAGGVSALGGVMMGVLPCDERGSITPEQVIGEIKPDDPHCPVTRLLCLENTVNGNVQDMTALSGLINCAKAGGLSVHLDGARLMNAAVAGGVAAAKIIANIDSVSLCLSKGLGAPVGSVLVGSASFIKAARRNRKMVGGGMRQSGILAAAGLYALDNHIDRLADDHKAAQYLAERLAQIPTLTVRPETVETNMVFMSVPENSANQLRAYLAARGIVLGGGQSVIRLVTHLDVGEKKIDTLIAHLKEFYA